LGLCIEWSGKRSFSGQGNHIFHPDGTVFIPFGGNMNGYKWGWNNVTTQHVNVLIEQWKFNTIRLNCYIKGYHRTSKYWNNGDFKGTFNVNNNLDQIIDIYTSRGVVVMIDAHDWTGLGINVSDIHDYYNNDKELIGSNQGETLENPFTELGGKTTYSSQIEILIEFFSYFAKKYKDNPYVWLNPLNEPGTVVDGYYLLNGSKYKQVPQYWAEMHKQFTYAMRDLGFKNPIVVDGIAAGQDHGQWWGQNPGGVIPLSSAIISKGQEVLNADPLKNTVFSFHAYHQWGKSSYPKLIGDYVDSVHHRGLALMIGEAGWYANKETDEPGVAFHRIFDQNLILGKKVGILSWHLQPGDGMALVNQGTFSLNNDPLNPTNLTWSGKEFWNIRNSIPTHALISKNESLNIGKKVNVCINNGILRIENAEGSHYKVINLAGVFLISNKIDSNDYLFNLESAPMGIYIVNVSNSQKSYSFKVFR
jgi:hypothetical protein